eukprot:scaffold76036_cov31-Tisochrysis_lutea.AAC.2
MRALASAFASDSARSREVAVAECGMQAPMSVLPDDRGVLDDAFSAMRAVAAALSRTSEHLDPG